jgi:hypothetical protein
MLNGDNMTEMAAMAKHIRGRLRAAGVKARCRCYQSCGVSRIQINTPTFDYCFSDEEQQQILLIADVNKLTLTRGGQIDLSQRTYAKGADFEFSR